MVKRHANWAAHAALWIAGMALVLAAGSCTRAIRMSVVDPGSLVTAPAERGGQAHPHVIRGDSIATQDDGLLVLAGDSLVVFNKVDATSGIMRDPVPPSYQRRRVVRELRVMGYRGADGRWRPWEGEVRARGDSLEFLRRATHPSDLRRPTGAETLRVASREIERVDLEETDPVRTAVALLLIGALFAGMTFVAVLVSGFASYAN
jgi:hypothetical protein